MLTQPDFDLWYIAWHKLSVLHSLISVGHKYPLEMLCQTMFVEDFKKRQHVIWKFIQKHH
jgi:hypothetical protein